MPPRPAPKARGGRPGWTGWPSIRAARSIRRRSARRKKASSPSTMRRALTCTRPDRPATRPATPNRSFGPVLGLEGGLDRFFADVRTDLLDESMRVAAQIDAAAHREARRVGRKEVGHRDQFQRPVVFGVVGDRGHDTDAEAEADIGLDDVG